MNKIFQNLTFQVLTAIALGIILGVYKPEIATAMQPLGETFIKLIKMGIAPIVFLTVVVGTGGVGNMKKLGRVGGKALLYFEIVTTFALVIGLIIANFTRPGDGIDISKIQASKEVQKYAESAHDMDWIGFFTHIIPSNIVKSFAEGEMLQILFFAVLFGIALNNMGTKGQVVLKIFDRLLDAFFGVLSMVMKLAPLGAFGGMAFTIGKYGVETLIPLAKLMLSVYATMALFIFVVLNLICRWAGFSLWNFLKYIKEEILIVLGTSSSESVLPKMMEKLEKYGCSKSVVALVIPTGYSFNLDGTTIYLSMASIFLAQAFHIDLTLTQEFTLIGILMLTSKGAAAVTGGGFIVLASTLSAMKLIPVEGIALLLGVDRFMSEARAITNLIGNGVATLVIAKSEGEFKKTEIFLK